MENKSNPCNYTIEITHNYEDWVQIRECWVKSFIKYPLYSYMVATDDRKLGEKFLRAYFEANYDATVKSGNAVLMCVKTVFCENFSFEEKIIGGVMILLPDQDSWGWKAKDQEPYDRAYDRQEMHKINPEALKRLKKYENWENSLLESSVKQMGPMWNAIFCALSPEYTSMKIGTSLYQSALDLISRCHHDDERSPLVMAVSHSNRSAHFHKSNGFTQITGKLIPYEDDGEVKFLVHLLKHQPCLASRDTINESSTQLKLNGMNVDKNTVVKAS